LLAWNNSRRSKYSAFSPDLSDLSRMSSSRYFIGWIGQELAGLRSKQVGSEVVETGVLYIFDRLGDRGRMGGNWRIGENEQIKMIDFGEGI
jgi:hypothetical protein